MGVAMRDSRYASPAFEMVHLLGLGLLLGSVLILDARFFGLGMKRQTTAELAADFAPWTRLALILMVLSGIPLFTSKAPDLWNDDRTGFELKIVLLLVGVVFHYAVLVPAALADKPARLAAGFSLLLWFGAALCGLSLEFL